MASRTLPSSRLPQEPLDEVLPIARALLELAAPSTKPRIAQHLGVSPAGGKFRARIASARMFGLIEKNGERYGLTARGTAALSDDEAAAQQAWREAVMGTSFGPILVTLKGREPNESTLVARLEDDFGVPSGRSLAMTLIRSTTDAQMITNGRFDVSAIEGAETALRKEPPAKAPASTTPSRANGTHSESGNGKPAAQQAKVREKKPKEEEKQPPLAEGLQVVVQIDASKLAPQEIVELVRSLRDLESESPEKSTS